jgi:hypothetical protein
LALFVLAAIAAIVARIVRSHDVERLQLKWFLLSAASFAVVVVAQEVLSLPAGIDDIPFGLAVIFLPVSIGVAILKYRLYDIDRIISRTLGYSILVVILALFYVTFAVWIPSRLIGEQPPVFVAAATLAAAAAFNPLRRLVLRFVDRRFYRSRYDIEAVMSNFASHLREQVDMDRLASDWLRVVIRTMGPTSAGVWMRKP